MTRLIPVALFATTLSACIIYERQYVPISPCRTAECDDTGVVVDPADPGEPTDPPVTDDLRLTKNEGAPGETLLSFLVAQADGVDVNTVEAIWFERDVAVLDSDRRPDEIVLLLSVAAAAEPGDVEVYVTTTGGGGWILAEPFHVLGGTTTTPPTDTSDTGAPTP